jgi:tubulin--tyrosine ligase-like protein 12
LSILNKPKKRNITHLMELETSSNEVAPQQEAQLNEEEYNKFIEFHKIQLYAVKFPEQLEKSLFEKLTHESFDIGSKVKIIANEEEESIHLQCLVPFKQDEDVYLIDHAWTFKLRDAENSLRENEGLLKRMMNITKYSAK